MNKHIELVKKWLADRDSVSQQELSDNRASAYAVNASASTYTHASAAAYAAYAANAAATNASAISATYWIDKAACWVKRYEELTK